MIVEEEFHAIGPCRGQRTGERQGSILRMVTHTKNSKVCEHFSTL